MTVENGLNESESKDPSKLLNGIYYTGDKGPRFGTRHTQVCLMTIGMGLVMVTKTCFALIYTSMTDHTPGVGPEYVPIYDWSNKGTIIGAVLWSAIPTQILGGYLGRIWGHKWLVLGLCIVDAIFFILIPLSASSWGSTGVVFCRVVQGAAQGALAPMGAVLNGYWIPAEEWSTVGVIGIAGSIIIAIVATISIGFIATSLGWPWCFYLIGIMELLWCVLWLFFSHQTPNKHPRITPEEKAYIQVSLKQREKKEDRKIPFKKILTSMPFYAVVVASIATDWIGTMQGTTTPLIMASLLNIPTELRSTIMGAGPILGILISYPAALASNLIIKRKILRRVNARRMFHSIGTIGHGLTVVLLTFVPPGNTTLVALNLVVGNIFIVLYSVGGSGINILDISPVFAGFVTGAANMVAHTISLFGPLSMDWIVLDQHSASEWRIVMSMTLGIILATTIFFDIFATDKRQEHWETNADETHEKEVN